MVLGSYWPATGSRISHTGVGRLSNVEAIGLKSPEELLECIWELYTRRLRVLESWSEGAAGARSNEYAIVLN